VLVLLCMTLLVFALLRLVPGNPVSFLAGDQATPEDIAVLTHQLGFDQPLPVQYGTFLWAILHGDLGTSIIYKTPAASIVLDRFPATIELSLCAILLTTVTATPLGIVTAVRRGSWVDHFGSMVGIFGVSIPSFWLGFMLILLVSVELGWAATSGRGAPLLPALGLVFTGSLAPLADSIRHLALPVMAMSSFQLAFVSRMARSSILDELGQTYVRAARARGLPLYLVIWKHALRNAMLPILTVLGLEIGSLIGGAVIIETVFAWPGVGQLIFQAIGGRDYPLAQAGIMIVSACVVLVTVGIDMLYGLVDPRIRYG
jgi:peptide/nickel transport system permease protein